MAKIFTLVNESGFNALANNIRSNNAAIKQDVSNFLLGHLQHFRSNGKKLDVLQAAVDFLLTERFRDMDVIATAITFLTPIKFNTDAANGRKKWINLEGEAKAKEDAKEAQIKTKMEQNRARWSNAFENFALGREIEVDNPNFYKGCNDNVAAHLQIPAKNKEDFNQDIYALVERLNAIRIEAKLLADERNGATSDNTIALSEEVGKVKKSFDSLIKKVTASTVAISDNYLMNASSKELESLDSYADEMEKTVAAMQEKLESLRGRISSTVATRTEQAAKAEEEEVLRKAAEIMAARQAA
ncbi:hypothetical protein PQC55_gp128 [Escherichia phage vB_EcoP-CHD5UKE1]|uniref:Uncharacterized protein n=1 Tax=Escherichia phage vB_EcoP-CHD5UKE1 TaxID=2865805 RepID=A0ABX9AFV6_9CAUD|nr:hypothetical protein PQC55_gp128 [Escherichia phage vB_EcoP-CHD5UKE1]QZI80630.1 hypothetical protein CHD5UKE1_134 [Escherichia phage vB_EcoP-CHD5UKE1]